MVLILYREKNMSDDLNAIGAAVFKRLVNHFREQQKLKILML